MLAAAAQGAAQSWSLLPLVVWPRLAAPVVAAGGRVLGGLLAAWRCWQNASGVAHGRFPPGEEPECALYHCIWPVIERGEWRHVAVVMDQDAVGGT